MKTFNMDEELKQFQKLGLSAGKAQETYKNTKIRTQLQQILQDHLPPSELDDLDKTKGMLIYSLASSTLGSLKATDPIKIPHLKLLVQGVKFGDIRNQEQLTSALHYVQMNEVINDEAYRKEAGIGIHVTEEQIQEHIGKIFKDNEERLVKERYKFVGILLNKIKGVPELKWAQGAELKAVFDKKILEVIGEKDERDVAVKKTKPAAPTKEGKNVDDQKDKIFREGELSRLHKPGKNPQLFAELTKEHLKATNGKVITRFPPEPNGFLHIGHAKAININFGYAKFHKGDCILRFDDTNPEVEEEVYFTSIQNMVKWLGFQPTKITYSSDYFQELFKLAMKLIELDLAYVCHCTSEAIHEHRGGDSMGPRKECSHRSRPTTESLAEFQNMKKGRYEEGKAIVRMKQDLLGNGNPQFWDLIAYRILYQAHHRTQDQWCIYPTYDFTHCLVDSIENITHSLCTTEFRQSRESYYWLCDALKVYKPVQWEYGRLSVEGSITSKRKLAQLVQSGKVTGWDDPRLFTLIALKRRGIPPEVINQFVSNLGVTTSNSLIEQKRFDNVLRSYLNLHTPRLMAVLNPIKVTITNLANDHLEIFTILATKIEPERKVVFTNVFYIDSSDFRKEDENDYFRLAPSKSVGLLHVPYPIKCTDFKTNEKGDVISINCTIDKEFKDNPKAFIQWVAESKESYGSPVKIKVHCFQPLFKHSNPFDKSLVPNDFLSDVDDLSLDILEGYVELGIWALIDKIILQSNESDDGLERVRAQFVRIGYFALDKTNPKLPSKMKMKDGLSIIDQSDELVFNRIVTLKEDANKN